jgi:hypothetical protein
MANDGATSGDSPRFATPDDAAQAVRDKLDELADVLSEARSEHGVALGHDEIRVNTMFLGPGMVKAELDAVVVKRRGR